MVQLSSFVTLGLVAISVNAAPILNKRIAQVIADSTTKWEQACLAAGGGQKCNPVSITAFTTLLAAAGPCEQQDAADSMVNLAKELNNNADMIKFSQIFVQQPRNSPNSVAIPYCQKAPQNAELNGLFQCQFVGSNQKSFANGAALGGSGTIPFGLNAPLNPLGSCPAHPDGPVADGQQLTDIVSTPGAPSDGNSGGAPPAATTAVPTSSATPATTVAAPPLATSSPAGGDLKLANGQAAQQLNAKFATLTADSPCTANENACIGTAFAQCVGGKFVTQSCGASPLTCAALPLVNSAGTSITCTTLADAEARIAATGATGGVTGDGSTGASSGSKSGGNEAVVKPSAPATKSGSGFRLQNGKDAKALNAKFSNLSASSSCTDGEEACVGTSFAQCVDGKFVTTPCGATLTCAALPLVNSPGTSITCAAPADVTARIAATGA